MTISEKINFYYALYEYLSKLLFYRTWSSIFHEFPALPVIMTNLCIQLEQEDPDI